MDKTKQIEILRQAIDKLHTDSYLCVILVKLLYPEQVYLKESVHMYPVLIRKYIPLFTRENSNAFSSAKQGLCWWEVYDKSNREKFLLWIINKLEKE